MRGLRILLVDDDFICSLEFANTLRDLGCNVVEAHCASAACETIKRREPLGALVTDIDLGVGKDGFAVARYARAAYPRLPVVYISGMAAGRYAAEGVADSVFLAKPFCPQQIVEALRGVIRLEAA